MSKASHQRLHARDRLRDNVTRDPVGAKILPCGHPAQGYPVSETRTHAYYRCSQGCDLQRIRKATPT